MNVFIKVFIVLCMKKHLSLKRFIMDLFQRGGRSGNILGKAYLCFSVQTRTRA